MFYTLDKDKIESFIKEGFEKKLGKGSVLNVRTSSYPHEYIVKVTLKKEPLDAYEIAHELRQVFIDNDLAVSILTEEAKNN